jgi:hypothetical protein
VRSLSPGSPSVAGETRYLRMLWRASLTPASLLTLDEAAHAAPGRSADARIWILLNVAPVGEFAGESIWRWGDIEEAIRGSASAATLRANRTPGRTAREPSAFPLTRWKAAAQVLGVSDDTVARRRKASDPLRRCHFQTADELVTWWRGISAPVVPPAPLPPKSRRKPRDGDAATVDWPALVKVISAQRG